MAPWKSIHTFFVSALLMWIVLGSTSLVFNAYHVGNVCVCALITSSSVLKVLVVKALPLCFLIWTGLVVR